MSATTTARVEVLTAEVRVLMVGSRQVTLSVFRQLDRVDHRDIEPWGRISDKAEANDTVTVVGRSLRTEWHRVNDGGALVRSSLSADRLRVEAHLWRTAALCHDDDGTWLQAHQREIRAVVAEEWARIADEWAALPLIVLAGLR